MNFQSALPFPIRTGANMQDWQVSSVKEERQYNAFIEH